MVMMYGWSGSNGWMMVAGMFVMLLVVFVPLAIVLVLAFRGGGGSAPSAPPGRARALQILDERLARGEITPEQYQATLDQLRGSGGLT